MKRSFPKYLKWVRTQPCIRCDNPDADPHHIKGQGNLSGVALKAPDWATMPLCARCHDIIQKEAPVEQWEWALRTLGNAIEQGVLK